jgi:hypothetical protein
VGRTFPKDDLRVSAVLIGTGVGALVREGTSMLKVVQEENESNTRVPAVGRSLLDDLVRDGARQMLASPGRLNRDAGRRGCHGRLFDRFRSPAAALHDWWYPVNRLGQPLDRLCQLFSRLKPFSRGWCRLWCPPRWR